MLPSSFKSNAFQAMKLPAVEFELYLNDQVYPFLELPEAKKGANPLKPSTSLVTAF